MMRPLLAAILLSGLAVSPAAADATFESLAAGAQPIPRLDNLVWALTASCEAGDDTQRRQCRIVRDRRVAELSGVTLLVEGDRAAVEVGAWSAQKKSVPLTVASCIQCSGIEVDGKTWYLVGTNPTAPRLVRGKLVTALLHDNAQPIADEAAARAFAQRIQQARVQMLVKVPARPQIAIEGKPALALDIVGHRVISPCDGSIVQASHKSGPVEADRKQCAPVTRPAAADAPRVDALSASMIQTGMRPVVAAATACFEKYGVAGKAKLKLTIGGDGSIAAYAQEGEFAGTPTGECIDEAVKQARFPASKKAKTTISYPIHLR
jgi:hypothetical protein